jgi:hypothetical protein
MYGSDERIINNNNNNKGFLLYKTAMLREGGGGGVSDKNIAIIKGLSKLNFQHSCQSLMDEAVHY